MASSADLLVIILLCPRYGSDGNWNNNTGTWSRVPALSSVFVITDFHDFDSNKDGVTDTTRSKTSIETAACAESESRRQIH
ncbi:hypothetical protein FPQ18DRAFT_403413 [Pyronema domesticum]|nr:hypothetical protein FPQ18DRAFT_403413 [Pyronema domesticum]